MLPHVELSAEVKTALDNHLPIIALESTLITHGLPYPHNVDVALACEAIARQFKVVPATIALMDGRIKIGLTATELERLAQDKQALKASKRDIPYILSNRQLAGTTVAATLFCAHRVGIRLFATGGIGGVHRGDHHDISADLIELAKTPIAVICAGAKSILDIAKTLEYLETYSIPVIGYRTQTFPAFYSATSPYAVTMSCQHIPDLVNILKTHWELNIQTGILIANPIPKEHEISQEKIDPIIENALQAAAIRGITGKAVTPFLLSEVAAQTHGNSLEANLHLIKHNTRVACELASGYYKTA